MKSYPLSSSMSSSGPDNVTFKQFFDELISQSKSKLLTLLI